MMNNFDSNLGGYGMMSAMGGWGTGWGSFWYLIMSLGTLVWVAVGVLFGHLAVQANRQEVTALIHNLQQKNGFIKPFFCFF